MNNEQEKNRMEQIAKTVNVLMTATTVGVIVSVVMLIVSYAI